LPEGAAAFVVDQHALRRLALRLYHAADGDETNLAGVSIDRWVGGLGAVKRRSLSQAAGPAPGQHAAALDPSPAIKIVEQSICHPFWREGALQPDRVVAKNSGRFSQPTKSFCFFFFRKRRP